MTQLIEFTTNHWPLVAALFAISGLLAYNLFQPNLAGHKAIAPGEAVKLINAEKALVIDVRAENEFTDGHILNAVNVPLDHLEQRLDTLGSFSDRPVIAYCNVGQKSGKACSILKKNGAQTIFNLTGGVGAWKEASLPLTRD